VLKKLEKPKLIELQFSIYVHNDEDDTWDLRYAHEDVDLILSHARRIITNNEFARIELCLTELESGHFMLGRHTRKEDTP
jgi:hypothetical protein